MSAVIALDRVLKVAIQEIPELGLKADEVSCLFNVPFMCDEKEAIVFVDSLYEKPLRTAEVRERLATVICNCVARHFNLNIEVFVRPFKPDNGFASFRRGT
ncbi:MAG: hypothetical protein UT91_C0017G0006 [Parcubacteria group bacterium GW2011_GWA2_40_23]|nr:MAG: hypothetical protein UT91_C0017G0006 [Parcubacteria group bacterium GW2011_GWA2_40_23]